MRFRDRNDAGEHLARAVQRELSGDVVVLGLPRGGVPVAAQVARALGAPLDVLCARKLGLPGYPELAMGAIGEGGVRVLDRQAINRFGVSGDAVRTIEARERAELTRQAARYRQGRPPLPLAGRTALIVDDGLATGSTAHAAARSARGRHAARVILAVPVAARDSLDAARLEVDDVIVVMTPPEFLAVGAWYDNFGPTTDDEVVTALRSAITDDTRLPATGPVVRSDVRIPAGKVTLDGWFDVPPEPRGVIVFAHGSGSSRYSRRNQAVAAVLNAHGFATLLFDLLTEAEADDRSLVFDIPLLSARLRRAVDWVRSRPDAGSAAIGLFGASTGAAAAITVASSASSHVEALVSRGGRPDLAAHALGAVRCPILMIVGGADRPTLGANEHASARLHTLHEIEIIPGAGHLFEEPGALEHVARLATHWFERFLSRPTVDGPALTTHAH